MILENTFTSIGAMAQHLFSFLKVIPPFVFDNMLWNKWESSELVGDLTLPILFLSSQQDEVTSFSTINSEPRISRT
eukprot:SAG31_NODE_866_length_11370_cov_4.806761_6_plen_76_part_00